MAKASGACAGRASSPTTPATRSPIAVPTFNPYYPTNAPTNLRVGYHMGIERPANHRAIAMAQRYQLGLNIALPADWAMQVYLLAHQGPGVLQQHGTTSSKPRCPRLWAGRSRRLPPAVRRPPIGTWTKPANVPYLNLFCDPRAYQCNSRHHVELSLRHRRDQRMRFHVRESGIKADGPLFDLPGGTVKMAIGANFTDLQLHHHADADQRDQSRRSPSPRIRARERLGDLRPAEHSDLQRAERAAAAPALRVRSLLAS